MTEAIEQKCFTLCQAELSIVSTATHCSTPADNMHANLASQPVSLPKKTSSVVSGYRSDEAAGHEPDALS